MGISSTEFIILSSFYCAVAAYLPSAEVEGTVIFTVDFPNKSCDALFESLFYPETD